MWHLALSQHLAQKICKTDKILAVQFIEHVFYLFETLYEDFEIDLEIALGFIKDLYLFAEQNIDRDVPLSEFAEECIGLLILHTKSSEELKIYVKDFMPLLQDEFVFSALDIEKEIFQLEDEEKIQSSNNFQEIITLIPDSVFLKRLIQIEKEVFAILDYTVSVGVLQLVPILHDLLSEIEEQFKIVSDLLFILLPLQYEDELFDQLILAVKNIGDKLLSPCVNDICDKLGEYVENSVSNRYALFFCGPDRQYGLEVAAILEQIIQRELIDVDSILAKLYEIRIFNQHDKLVNIIQSIEQHKGLICEV